MNQTIHIPQTPNERLKEIRNRFNFNQKAFAHAMDYKPSYYSELENGKKEMTSRLLITLIERFNVSADWMLTGKGQMFLVDPVPARLALHEKCHPSPYTGFVRVVMPFIKS